MRKELKMGTYGLLVALVGLNQIQPEAVAQRTMLSGPRGKMNYGRGTYTGPYGGYVRGGGAFGLSPGGNAGFAAGAHQGVGANGTTWAGTHAGAFKKGTGFFNGNAYSVQGANGNSLNHYSGSAYNAQTGKGFASGASQGTINGQQVGDQYQFSGQKGQGISGNVDTLNHGDYSVQVPAGGGKPIVTQTAMPPSGQ